MKDNKILLITGASSDVGIELIRQVAENYSVVLAHYCHSKESLEKLNQEVNAEIIPLQADFSDIRSVQNMIEQIKGVGNLPDHIVHLAAPKLSVQKYKKISWDEFENGIQTSLRSVFEITQAFLPNMTKHKYGRVIFMLTSNTLNMPAKFQTSYVTVKYALLGLMKALSVEYADKGITVNGISPDMMDTKFLAEIPELIVQQNAINSPLKRNLMVQDVVPTFQYLLSDAAEAITGQNIGITGGVN